MSSSGMSEVEDGRLMARPSCCEKPFLSAAANAHRAATVFMVRSHLMS